MIELGAVRDSPPAAAPPQRSAWRAKPSHALTRVPRRAAAPPLRGAQEEKMEKSIESVRRNFNTVRTGRANVSILDRIQARKRAACAARLLRSAPAGLQLRRAAASLLRSLFAPFGR